LHLSRKIDNMQQGGEKANLSPLILLFQLKK